MKKYFLLLLLVGTAIMIFVMAKTSTTLKTTATPCGILNLEFANNTAKTTKVINAWAPNNAVDNIRVARINTYYDFIFILFYASFLFFTAKKIARINNSKAGLLFAKGALLAGLLDVSENAGMLITLAGSSSATIALLTAICSLIKWGLVILVVVYCLAGIIYLMRHKKFKLLFA